MRVQEMMTRDPACCTPETGLQEVAQMMVDCDCGAIPVVRNQNGKNLIGMVTDRDITVRAVAKGRDPLSLSAGDVMSTPAVSIRPDDTLQEAARVMEKNQIRRIPVTDSNGSIGGIVAQADLALQGSDELTGEVVEQVSQPTSSPSDVDSKRR